MYVRVKKVLHSSSSFVKYSFFFQNKLETVSEELKKKTEFAEELQSMVCEVFLGGHFRPFFK